jgi:hypothetical protein
MAWTLDSHLLNFSRKYTKLRFIPSVDTLNEDPRFSESEFKSFVKGLGNQEEKWSEEFLNGSASGEFTGLDGGSAQTSAKKGTIIFCECHGTMSEYFLRKLLRIPYGPEDMQYSSK